MRPPPAPRGNLPSDNLSAAHSAWNILSEKNRRNEWPAARIVYNRALASAFDDLRRASPDWNEAATSIGTRWEMPSEIIRDPNMLGSVFPASRVGVSRVGERKTRQGIGLPLVGWVDSSHELYRGFSHAPPSGISVTSSAILRFEHGSPPTWALINPYKCEAVSTGSVNHPLEVDFSAGHALYWRMGELDKHQIGNLLRPDRLAETEGIFFAQPLDPDLIPVVFVHGLKSSPSAFAPMLNELMGEEWFRKNYQAWAFSYPTGVPWMISAARFRKHFDAAMTFARNKGVTTLDHTVVVGHSMGGLITHASIKDPGNEAYPVFAHRPIHELDLRADERRMVEDTFLWKPMRPVSRAIFIATPHRGSPMADTYYSMVGSKLIQLPKTLTVDFTDTILRNATAIADPESLTPEERVSLNNGSIRIPTVIESLSPQRPSIKALQKMTFPEKVQLHSIIGDRGKNQVEDGSDGVVPYWSSHLPEANSQLIVPSHHGAAEHPATIAETKRILQLHLRKISR